MYLPFGDSVRSPISDCSVTERPESQMDHQRRGCEQKIAFSCFFEFLFLRRLRDACRRKYTRLFRRTYTMYSATDLPGSSGFTGKCQYCMSTR